MKEPYFITKPYIDLRPYIGMKVTLTDRHNKTATVLLCGTPRMGKIRYFICSCLFKLIVWFLMKGMGYPFNSFVEKLNGNGFVVVPMEQWQWLNKSRNP